MSIIKFNDIDEAIEKANDNEYGLAGAVFSKDIDNIMKVTSAIRAGTIWLVGHTRTRNVEIG